MRAPRLLISSWADLMRLHLHCRVQLIAWQRISVTRCTRCNASKLGITGTSLTPALRLQNLSNVTACSRLHTLRSLIFIAVSVHRIWGLLPRTILHLSWKLIRFCPTVNCPAIHSTDDIALPPRSSTCAILEVYKSLIGTAAHCSVGRVVEMQIWQSTRLACCPMPI